MVTKNRKLLCTLALNLAIAAGSQWLGTATARANAGDLFATDPVAGSVIVYALDGTMRTFATGLSLPQGITFDSNGNLFVADEGAGKIYQFTADGTRSLLVSGLNKPIGLTFDGKDLAVAEHGTNQITHVHVSNGNVSAFRTMTAPVDVQVQQLPLGATPSPSPSPTVGPSPTPDPTATHIAYLNATNLTTIAGDGTTRTFSNLVTDGRGIAIDGSGDVFVSSGAGGTITELPYGATSTADAVTFATGLNTPSGLAFRPKAYSTVNPPVSNLFVAEMEAGQVSQFDPAGTKTVFATGGNPKYLSFERILPGKLLNISTRGEVKTGDNVLISGFIITGTKTKTVLLRGLGPSLGSGGVTGALTDPILELHKPDGTIITNDNWKSNSTADKAIITGGNYNMTRFDQYMIDDTHSETISDSESIIVAHNLVPGAYTAILRGVNDTTGVALAEAYDLDDPTTSTNELGNISTRGYVEDGENVMIGGFIIQPGEAARVLVRAIGPELANAKTPVPNPLADPTLDLMDVNGNVIRSNDNWKDNATAAGEIAVSGVAPTNDKEPAILANLVGGTPYTAIVRGANGGTGVALIEVYHLP